jgi:hypothetical protein
LFHAIIIPHRNRWNNLELCAESIETSAINCGLDDYRIIVVNDGPCDIGLDFEGIEGRTILQDNSQMPILNKPYLQNIGIECAVTHQAEVLSFLDADAIVGPRWMENVFRLRDDPTLTKLCYRVRYIKAGTPPDFNNYESFPLATESYGRPEHNAFVKGPIFGNSQFSIRRDVLRNTRFNEDYAGRGFEDLWMNRELWIRDPDVYRAEIVTDAAHAMYHIQNTLGGSDWFDVELNAFNARMYRGSWCGMQRLLPLSDKTRKARLK